MIARLVVVRVVAFLLLALAVTGAHAQAAATTASSAATPEAVPRYAVALFTVAPGEVYWERFGHNGILIRDEVARDATLYHYGIFDFGEKNFFWNFIRGYMTYSMIAVDPRDDLAEYRAEGRGVTLQWLDLSAAQADALHAFLEWNARPENAKYRYDYFRANCSTKVRDALDRVLDGALSRATQSRSRGVTYRMQALRLTAPDVPLALGIDVGLGPYADRPVSRWEEQFVPAELARDVATLTTGDDARPLVAREEILLPAVLPPPPAMPPTWRWLLAASGLAIALVVYACGRSRRVAARRAYGGLVLLSSLVATIGGAMLLFLWWGTEHVSAWRNANALLFDPMCVLLIPAACRALADRAPGTPFARRVAWIVVIGAFLALALRLTVTTPQDVYGWVLAWIPIHVAVLTGLRDERRDVG